MRENQDEREASKKAREDDAEEDIAEEQIDFIEKKIKDQIQQIQEGIDRIEFLKSNKSELSAHFDTLFSLYKHLREYLANIVFCLPSYTQQQFQSEVDRVHKTLTAQKDKAIPKKRFAFKSKPKKRPGEEKIKPEYATVKEEMKDVQDLMNDEFDLIIRKKKNEILIVDPADYEGKDKVYLENIENCDIFLPFIIKALFVKNTYYSRIYVGVVLGAAYIETTNKSAYYISAHQVRIHKANEVQFYL